MEQVYNNLAARTLALRAKLRNEDPSRLRILIALSGPPGSGKSTIAAEVARRIIHESNVPTAVVAMDGFHYSREYLDSLPNREEAHARRGAHWTFDADGVVQLVRKLHESRKQETALIRVPGFDHALKDPVADETCIAAETEIVILEGNWLLFDNEPWSEIPGLMDDTWFVDVDPWLARGRVAARHIKSGIEESWEAALARVDGNDFLNGEEVRRHLIAPNVRVVSIEVEAWRSYVVDWTMRGIVPRNPPDTPSAQRSPTVGTDRTAMNNARPAPASSTHACLQCQKRKTKCIQDRRSASCTYCVRARKECTFGEPPSRTPLTRKNLDALEQRCSRLERLLLSLGQGISLESELEKVSARQDIARAENEVGDATSNEEYEWHESPESAGVDDRDLAGSHGLASMAVESSGYLGSSSISNILQSISALLPQFEASPRTSGPISYASRVAGPLPGPQLLMLNASLATDAETNRLVDAYFSCYNSSYPILHEASFRKKREQRTRANPASCWTAIHAIVLAIGQWIIDEEPQESPYFAIARSWLSARALESGTLPAGNYVQKRGRPNTAYNMIGIAYRMALALGMHREITHQRQDSVVAEWRRRVFWTLFCFDSGLSITTGRPTTIIGAFTDVRMPRNIDDSFLEPDLPVPDEVDYPTPTSAIIAQASLAVIANEIHRTFWSLKAPQIEENYDTALMMEVKLFNWRNTLPRYFTSAAVPDWFLGPRAVVFWKEQNLRMLLWRTRQRRHTTTARKSVADWKCYAAAVETIRDVSVFCKEHPGTLHTGLSWYATYFLFQALLVLEVSQVDMVQPSPADSLNEDTSWGTAMAQGRDCLQLLNKSNTPAGRCLETLDRIQSFLLPRQRPSDDPIASVSGNLQLEAQQTPPPVTDMRFDPDLVAPDMLDLPWNISADPSLHMLLNDRQMDTIFRGVEGFPGTLDQDSVDYMGGYSFDF